MRSLDKSAAADRKPDCRYFNALSRPVKFTRQTSEDQASTIVLTAKRRHTNRDYRSCARLPRTCTNRKLPRAKFALPSYVKTPVCARLDTGSRATSAVIIPTRNSCRLSQNSNRFRKYRFHFANVRPLRLFLH